MEVDIESKMPKEKVRWVRMTIRKVKVKMPRAKGRKETEIRKEKKVIIRERERQRCCALVESQGILLKTVGGAMFDR